MAAPFGDVIVQNDERILNYCTKYLARGNVMAQHGSGTDAYNLSNVAERWRFPLVIAAVDGNGFTNTRNEIVFIWHSRDPRPDDVIEVYGSFAPLYTSVPLQAVTYDGRNTGFYACTILVPVGQSYYYRFRVNGEDRLDPVNQQKKVLHNGREWSFVFTDYYNSSEEFEEWEMNIMKRLANRIVPFRTNEAQNFINRYYLTLARPDRLAMPIYKLDESVGEINYITNILAREERHHLPDYRICLQLIDEVLRQRNPFVNAWQVDEELINVLYDEMAHDNVAGWDYNRYNKPSYFLALLRRHTITGAFSHPKYGGNIGGAGWDYLKEKFPVKNDQALTIGSFFDWSLALERPLGLNQFYIG